MTLEPQQEDSYRSQLNESTGIERGSVFVGKCHKNALFSSSAHQATDRDHGQREPSVSE